MRQISSTLSLSQQRDRALVMALQYLGLFGGPHTLSALATEWEVSHEAVGRITARGKRLLRQQAGSIDDLPLSSRVKKILRDPPAPFSRMVTLEEFHTVIAHITDAELMTWPGIGRKTVAQLRTIWRAIPGDQRKTF
jgi:hypothetical protein